MSFDPIAYGNLYYAGAGASQPTLASPAVQAAAPQVTYTPNGIPRAPGYFDPNNPFDTGRAGERNAELNGGRKSTVAGWNYDTGTPNGNFAVDANGVYQIPGLTAGGGGGGGGGDAGIPGASQLAEMAAQGLAEYKKAVARYNQQRNQTMTTYGYKGQVDPETGVVSNMVVDPHNPYGTYQTMRYNNAVNYAQLRNAAFDRGLGGRGLGAQDVEHARFQWGSADAAMAQSLQQTLFGYDAGQQDAHQTYQNLLWQIELERIREAAANAQFPQYSGGGGGDAGGGDAGGGDMPPLAPGYTLPFGGDPSIKTGGGYYTGAHSGDLTAKWQRLARTQ